MSPRNYLICTTPRTGSSLLCSLLAQTELAGMRPSPTGGNEYFLELVGRAAGEVDWAALDLRKTLADYFCRAKSRNGVSGFKLMWLHLARLGPHLRSGEDAEGFRPMKFPDYLPRNTRFIHLVRRDTVRQAVSLIKAMETDAWDSNAGHTRRGLRLFDYFHIQRTLERIDRHNRRWSRLFERNGIEPLELVYEDFVADQEGTVRRILDFLNVPVPKRMRLNGGYFRRQSDSTNDQWVERFKQIRARGPFERACYSAWFYPQWVLGRPVRALRSRMGVRGRA